MQQKLQLHQTSVSYGLMVHDRNARLAAESGGSAQIGACPPGHKASITACLERFPKQRTVMKRERESEARRQGRGFAIRLVRLSIRVVGTTKEQES